MFHQDKLSAKPIIQVIDDWRSNRQLALAFEAKVGKGKLLVCCANLSSDSQHLVSRQLLYSLQQFIQEYELEAQDCLTIEEVQGMSSVYSIQK